MNKLSALLAALASLAAWASPVHSDTTTPSFPTHAIKLIVPQSPGSVADIIARAIGPRLSAQLGQTVVIENRAGASGIVGAQSVARSAPDGYTLLIGSVSTHGLLSGIYPDLSYHPINDFKPIVHLNDSPLVFVTHPGSGLRSLMDVVTRARAEPGQLFYASAGNGSGSRFTAELLRLHENLDMVHVPYKSPMEAVTAVMAQQATIAVPSVPSTPQYIQAGKLVALAVTGKARSPLLPDVPTTAEQGYPDVDFTSWTGLFAPAGTPDKVVETLNRAANDALHDPEVIRIITNTGATPTGGTPQALGHFVQSEVDKWVKAAQDAQIVEVSKTGS